MGRGIAEHLAKSKFSKAVITVVATIILVALCVLVLYVFGNITGLNHVDF